MAPSSQGLGPPKNPGRFKTCKLNGVDPQRYFTDLLIRLVNGWPNSRIDELMPWCWARADEQTSSAAT
ncbi:transposase domain-containing protein [Roseomonas mucosa]|uniref:transposase domain-containing protein n=1 Tax=Roseomonas mucosa TaxID=207340 RepID=UPI00351DED4C